MNYWDYLGWPDALASPAHTDRQEDYQYSFGNMGLYTPEMVVGAEEERASTNAGAVASHIDRVLENPVDVSTTVWLESEPDAAPLVAGYLVADAPGGAELWVVLVERDIVHEIAAGENRGRTLEQDNVARTFAVVETVADTPEGAVELDPPDGLVPESSTLIAFVQDPETMALFGATDTHLTE